MAYPLAFYIDYIAAESNLVTAQEENSVRDLASELGAETELNAGVQAVVDFYMNFPAAATGTEPEKAYFAGTWLAAGLIAFVSSGN